MNAGGQASRRQPNMAQVLFRCFLDAIYTVLFFIIMSSAAYGMHLVVEECAALGMDPIVLFILKWMTYLLAGVDAIGVLCAATLLTFRFVRAIRNAND